MWSSTSLRTRFILVMLAGCAVFSSAVLLVADSESRTAFHGRTVQTATAQLVAHSDVMAERVLIDDEQGVRAFLVSVLTTNPDWNRIGLTRPGRGSIAAVRREGTVALTTDDAAPPGFPVYASILDGAPGQLTAWVSEGPDRRAADGLTRRLFVLLIALSAGGIGAAALFGWWLTASLVNMAKSVRALGDGHLSGEFPVPSDEGEVTILAEALRDTTRGLLEAQGALDSNRRRMVEVEKLAAVGGLAAGVAHEVANPIAGAVACVRRLERADLPTARRVEYAALATEARDRAGRVLRELLAYARPGMEGTQEVDVSAAIDAAVRLVGSSTHRELRIKGGPPIQARWPRQQVDQVLTNLLLNAAQAATACVTIAWIERGDLVVTEIIDDGPPIPPAVLARAFEPFFTTRAVGDGTGLGLSVSLALANAMGGWIELEAVTGGAAAGTVARFAVPRIVLEPANAAENPAR